MPTTIHAAKTLRSQTGTTGASEPDIAVLARGLIDRDGNVVLSGDNLAAGEDPGLGTPTTVEADQDITIGGNAQAIIYGAFTIEGTVTVEGVMRFGPLPF